MKLQIKNICSLLTKLQRQLKSGSLFFRNIFSNQKKSPRENECGWLLQKQEPDAKKEPGSTAFNRASSSRPASVLLGCRLKGCCHWLKSCKGSSHFMMW